MTIYDDLVQRMSTNTRGLSLILDDPFTVLDEERAAVARVVAVVTEWSLSDRRR